MKKLFFLLLLISSRALSQEDTTRYLKYPGAYGSQYTRGWFTKSFRVPFIDTVAINALPGALQAGLDGNPYWWNGVKWGRLGGTGDLSAYIKFADSSTKYITPAQLASYNYLSGISGIAAGGDLTGTYPNPAVSLFNGNLPSFYLDRANHTGKQPYTTITGLATVASTGYYTDLTGAPAALPTTSGLDDVLANNNSSSKNIHAFDIYASDGFVSNNYYTPSFGVRLYDGALDVGSNFNLGSTHSGYITGFTYQPATGSIVYYGPQVISATNGNGYTLYNPQVSSPGAPVSGFVLYAKSTGALAWKGVNGYQRSFPAGSLTADRDYTLPDASGTLALTASTLAGYGIADAIKNTTSIQAGANIAIDGSIGLGAAVRAGNQLDIQNSNAGMSINTSDASNAANIYINRSTGTPAVPTIPSSALSIGSLQFNTYSGTGALTTNTNSAVIQAGMDATPSTTSTPGYLAFKTTPAGSLATVERMRINSGGNIGVGTISPAYKLDVQGTSATSAISSDIGYNINPVAVPAAPSLATIAASGNLGIGVYRYTISITTALGETNSPQTVTVTTASGNQQVLVSWAASTDYRATGYKIYRTAVNGNDWQTFLLTTVVGAATASYTDNIADASLTGNSGVGTYHINTTSNFITVNSSKVFQADIKATILGAQAGINLNGGGDVALFGYQAGRGLITALETTMIGQMSGRQLTSGINQLFGYDIMSNLTTGSATGNVLVGHRDLWRATSAGANTVVGHDALYGAGTGSYTYNNNVSIGYQSGWSAQTVSNNTYLGFQSGFTNTAGNANVFLGYQAGYYETGSNKLFIDNAQRANESDARVKALMYGVFASTVAGQSLTVNGSLAVNSGASLTGVLTQTATLTAAGTTGAQTINKPSGSVNFAAGATTLVVTNSLVTAGSQIFLQVYGTDATARYATVTLGSGSFTITLNSAATGETKVGFRVDATQ